MPLLYRDFKPDNICYGTGENKDKLFLFDFGLAKLYIQNDKHIEFREDRKSGA